MRRALGILALAALALIAIGLPNHGIDAAASGQTVPAPQSTTVFFPATNPALISTGGLANHLSSGYRIAVIPIRGHIDDFQLVSLRYRVQKALRGGATLIVLELDTDGGSGVAALPLSRYIKTLNVPTVAWIHERAISAGILIAAACNHIVMSPVSAAGDCAPIVISGNTLVALPPTERLKFLSPVLADFRDSATRNHYDIALFHAMCEVGIEVYEVRNPATGQTRLVNQADYQVMVEGREPQDVRVPGLAGDPVVTGQLPTGTISPADLVVATAADSGKWELVRRIHNGKTLLTVNQTEALDIGLAKDVFASESALAQSLSAVSVTRYEQSWVESVAYFLTLDWIRGILIVMLMIGMALEFHAPGTTFGGAMAGVALVVLLGAPWLLGLAELWHILLVLAGFVLLGVELFAAPGVFIPGLLGVICIFVGLVLAVVPSSGGGIGLPTAEGLERLQWSILWMLLGLVAGSASLYALSQYLGHIPVFNKLILHGRAAPVGPEDHGAASGLLPPVSGDEAVGGGRIKAGDRGVVVSELRPSGRARIAEQVVDVLTEGQWLSPGRKVRVVEARGNRIVVAAEDQA